jgi:hypothetical protein
MKVIHVERIRSTYRASLPSEGEGLSKTVVCGGSEQLIAALGKWGASPTGIFEILKQLESSTNAELRVQDKFADHGRLKITQGAD